MISGIDLSDKNGSADWSLFGNGDVNFVYIKASESIDTVDTLFSANMAAAHEYGILAGAYHWLYPSLHVGQQAELFIEAVGSFKGLLPPVVCLETEHTSISDMEKNVRIYLDLVESASGVKPVIFTSDSYWRKYLPESIWGCEYPLWLDKPGNTWPKPIMALGRLDILAVFLPGKTAWHFHLYGIELVQWLVDGIKTNGDSVRRN